MENKGVGSRFQRTAFAERTDAVDRAGITVLRRSTTIEPARQLILGVRVRHDVVAVTVMHLGESDITCGAARSIVPGRASQDVRSFRNNVASSARMATHP
jgi:hypothetical protein